MRNLVLVLLGLAVGVLGSVNIINALQRRDAYPRGLMNVMQHHLGALREDLKRGRCSEASLEHVARLRQLAPDIGAAVYGGDTPDAPFREFEQRLSQALAAAPPSCGSGVAPAAEHVASVCDDCHRQYR